MFLKNRRTNDKEGFAISFCLCSSGKLGEDQTLSLIWPPPSWFNLSVFKWHFWHGIRQGYWFVILQKCDSNFLGYRLGRSFSKTYNDIWNFLQKLMWSVIWKAKALPQTLRFPLLVNWCQERRSDRCRRADKTWVCFFQLSVNTKALGFSYIGSIPRALFVFSI